MWSPIDVVVDSHDNLFVLDNTNARIVKITPGGTLSFFAGTGQMYGSIPAAVEGPALNSPLYNATGLGIDDFDDEYSRMAQHVEELQGMSEVEGEDL